MGDKINLVKIEHDIELEIEEDRMRQERETENNYHNLKNGRIKDHVVKTKNIKMEATERESDTSEPNYDQMINSNQPNKIY